MDKKLGCRMSMVNQLSLMENCVGTDAVVKEFPWLTDWQVISYLMYHTLTNLTEKVSVNVSDSLN